MGFSRQEWWRGLPCPPPGDLPDPGVELTSLHVSFSGRWVLTTSAAWEAYMCEYRMFFSFWFTSLSVTDCRFIHITTRDQTLWVLLLKKGWKSGSGGVTDCLSQMLIWWSSDPRLTGTDEVTGSNRDPSQTNYGWWLWVGEDVGSWGREENGVGRFWGRKRQRGCRLSSCVITFGSQFWM